MRYTKEFIRENYPEIIEEIREIAQRAGIKTKKEK